MPDSDYMKMLDEQVEYEDHKFDEPDSRENNLEYDLLTTDWILEKVRTNKAYAQNLYAAMCNNSFKKNENEWHCSWRYAGGIVSNMRQEGGYIDWYCSGIRDVSFDEEINKSWDGRNYVREEFVTEEIEEDLNTLGWTVVQVDED